MKEFYVYQLRVEGEILPFYIGKGKGDRAYRHFKESRLKTERNLHKINKLKKAKREGKEVLVEFLRESITEKQALRLEKFWIAKIGRNDLGLGPLTNQTSGGDGLSGRLVGEEERDKISKACKGKLRTDETKAKMSIANKGENNPFHGKTHSEEARKRIGDAVRKRMAERKQSQSTSA